MQQTSGAEPAQGYEEYGRRGATSRTVEMHRSLPRAKPAIVWRYAAYAPDCPERRTATSREVSRTFFSREQEQQRFACKSLGGTSFLRAICLAVLCLCARLFWFAQPLAVPLGKVLSAAKWKGFSHLSRQIRLVRQTGFQTPSAS